MLERAEVTAIIDTRFSRWRETLIELNMTPLVVLGVNHQNDGPPYSAVTLNCVSREQLCAMLQAVLIRLEGLEGKPN